MTLRQARLDAELVRRGLARSRAQARALIEHGSVLLDGVAQEKGSASVRSDSLLAVRDVPDQWVGRGAHKLLGALDAFAPGLSVTGKRCLDVGAGTGGFTQVLLRAGAREVVALDVGRHQLSGLLGSDLKVTDHPGRNIRDVAPGDLGAPFELIVADLSFISIRLALGPIAGQLSPAGDLVVLVKPQFEVGRERLGRSGIVSSGSEHARVLREVTTAASGHGLSPRGLVPSPIRGGEGNQEYLLWVTPRPGEALDAGALEALIEQVKGPP